MFHDDLRRGQEVERRVLAIVLKDNPSACLINGYSGYDIWMPEKGWGIEVKYDPRSKETGNYAIEIEMGGKPSALLTTKAKWWVIYDDIQYAWIQPKDIFQCILLNRLRYVEFTGPGDYKPKKVILIEKNLLLAYANVYEEPEDEF